MPEFLIPVFVFYLIYLHRTMKNSKPASTKKTTAAPQTTESQAPAAKQATAKTLSPAKKAPAKPKAVTAKPTTPALDLPMPERVGLTAGSVWQYLAKHGPTSVAKLVKELPEDEKIIQRSIGWLAQEGKISLDTIDRLETIALAG